MEALPAHLPEGRQWGAPEAGAGGMSLPSWAELWAPLAPCSPLHRPRSLVGKGLLGPMQP